MRPTRVEPILPWNTVWPKNLTGRMGNETPAVLHALGAVPLLLDPMTALFCSVRTPGDAILRAYDTARWMREEGVTVISGFHSPIEKECLDILLRGKQSIVICPGRAIDSMRIPTKCRASFDAGRILFLSPFSKVPRRVTRESALRRNEFVAALADRAYVANITRGGNTEHIMRMLKKWGVPIISDCSSVE